MNKKLALYFSLSIIVIFILFMIYDSLKKSEIAEDMNIVTQAEIQAEEKWEISHSSLIPFGKLKAVSASSGGILVGGDSFIARYTFDYKLIWKIDTDKPVTAISEFSDTIYVATPETIMVYSSEGLMLDEWGPYDENAIITSLSASSIYVGFADAGNKIVFILNKAGAVKSIIGQPGDHYVIPSPYFDLSISDEQSVIIANPGKRSVEYRNITGDITGMFGEAGTGLEYFCGCCNPSHFALMPGGNLVTAEKGINRIKIVDQNGKLIELVAQPDNFMASVPVDLATYNNTIIAVNPADSKLYTFKRR